MTEFTGRDAVESFLAEFDGWLSEAVRVYLLGGSAMAVRGLKDRTRDLDLALAVTEEFEHVYRRLRNEGFVVEAEPTEPFENVGRTVTLAHAGRGLHLDVFERQIVGKVWLSRRMRERAERYWSGTHATAFVLADEDMFLLKAVAGGDVASGRRRDVEDAAVYAQRGLDYDVVVEEIESQRPFNVGATEATQIWDRSHPLFAVEISVDSLSGLPSRFTDRVSGLATEFEVEHFVLRAVDDDLTDVERIRARVKTAADALAPEDGDEVDAAIDRLVRKRVLVREDGTVREMADSEPGS